MWLWTKQLTGETSRACLLDGDGLIWIKLKVAWKNDMTLERPLVGRPKT
jgi:hypothetical protein